MQDIGSLPLLLPRTTRRCALCLIPHPSRPLRYLRYLARSFRAASQSRTSVARDVPVPAFTRNPAPPILTARQTFAHPQPSSQSAPMSEIKKKEELLDYDSSNIIDNDGSGSESRRRKSYSTTTARIALATTEVEVEAEAATTVMATAMFRSKPLPRSVP